MTTILEKHVLLVTSDSYKVDILNLLFLEKGMKYRFRYREQWIPSDFFEKGEDGKEKYLRLMGKKGLIIFYDITRKEFFPILIVVIRQIEKIGDILLIEFSINDLVRYGVEDKTPNEYHSLIKKCIPKKLIDSQPWELKKFVLFESIPINEIAIVNDMISWSRILHNIWRLNAFENSLFMRMIKLTDSRGKIVKPKEISTETREVGYILDSSKIYRIEILQRTRNDFQNFNPFRVRLFCISEHITPIKENALVVGKYDKLELALHTKWRKSDTISIIGLRSNESIDINLPEVYIPLKIKKSIKRLIGSLSSIIAGFSATTFSKNITHWLQLSESVSPLIGLIGGALVALGTAWLRPMYE